MKREEHTRLKVLMERNEELETLLEQAAQALEQLAGDDPTVQGFIARIEETLSQAYRPQVDQHRL